MFVRLFPIASAKAAFQINARAFLQILLSDFSLATEKDHTVPFRFFYALLSFCTSAIRGRSDAHRSDLKVVSGKTGLRIPAEIAENNYFIQKPLLILPHVDRFILTTTLGNKNTKL